MKDSVEAAGIVLIDEIDMHLHPKWQWKVLHALENTFPNMQFIIATHAPIVISSCKTGNMISIFTENASKGKQTETDTVQTSFLEKKRVCEKLPF